MHNTVSRPTQGKNDIRKEDKICLCGLKIDSMFTKLFFIFQATPPTPTRETWRIEA